LQGFYSSDFPVGSVIYPATVGKVTPENRYSFPTGSVKVHPKGRYSFPVGSVIGRRRRTARTFPRNTAVRRYLSHQRRHRTACCGRSRASSFPTRSVLFPRRVGIVSPQGRYSELVGVYLVSFSLWLHADFPHRLGILGGARGPTETRRTWSSTWLRTSKRLLGI
jgi:hypothetical protein